MLQTPLKNNLSNFNSLKQQIQMKLKSDSKIGQKKYSLSKKCQSHNKDKFQYFPTNSNEDKFQLFQSAKKYHQTNLQNKNKNANLNLKISQENILQYQSLQNPQFFGYQQWLQFNKKYFSYVEDKFVNNFWKIIRIVNYGDVFVPSGLVFQISKCLTMTPIHKQKSLKKIFNQFLAFNEKKDTINNFKQLKMYPSLQQIQKQYQRINKNQKQNRINYSLDKNVSSSLFISKKKQSSLNMQANVFQRIYNDSKSRKAKRNTQICQSLIHNQQTKQCIFTPQIKQYFHQKLFTDSTFRPERICQSKQKWQTKRQQFQVHQENKTFKASEFNRTIFLNRQLQQIPGVTEYLSRKKYSESQKRKIQRFLQKPTQVFRHD